MIAAICQTMITRELDIKMSCNELDQLLEERERLTMTTSLSQFMGTCIRYLCVKSINH